MLLERVQIDSGVKGLPITAEASSWLANQVLYQLDRILEGIPGLSSLRWSDDEFLVDGVPTLVEHAQSQRTQYLRSVGLVSSEEKTIRSWQSGQSGSELLLGATVSQGDINFVVKNKDTMSLWIMLYEELMGAQPDKSRLNRLYRAVLQTPEEGSLPELIVDRMLKYPDLWECSCVRASRFLDKYASPEQVIKVIGQALDLVNEGPASSEQVTCLLRAISKSKEPPPSALRGLLAKQLLGLARSDSCPPVRLWARHCAYRLDPERVRGATIDSGEFGELHPFEQRIAIAYADPRRHEWWLNRETKQGNWPTTAAWMVQKPRRPDMVLNI